MVGVCTVQFSSVFENLSVSVFSVLATVQFSFSVFGTKLRKGVFGIAFST
ncbi:hypothetical protein HanRHA438_Chr09g0406201 [Helianthus annuus]|nr:hypothetical protein HanRHA438_Chr09g0406201 [Helianthus annuus]